MKKRDNRGLHLAPLLTHKTVRMTMMMIGNSGSLHGWIRILRVAKLPVGQESNPVIGQNDRK